MTHLKYAALALLGERLHATANAVAALKIQISRFADQLFKPATDDLLFGFVPSLYFLAHPLEFAFHPRKLQLPFFLADFEVFSNRLLHSHG